MTIRKHAIKQLIAKLPPAQQKQVMERAKKINLARSNARRSEVKPVKKSDGVT